MRKVLVVLLTITSIAVLTFSQDKPKSDPGPLDEETNLQQLLAIQVASAVERTSTGFYYPTGSSLNINPLCGKWMGRDASYGGCYIDGKYHIGVDIAAPQNSDVFAIADGEIVYISLNGWTSGSTTNVGIFVKHRRNDGTYFLALYGHVLPNGTISGQPKQLAAGDRVLAGQAFAKIGDWNGSGDHLHFGVVPTTTLPPTATGRGFGMMSNSLWADSNTFVNPIQFVQTERPWGSSTSGSFTLSASPVVLTIMQGSTAAFTVAVGSTGGFSGIVGMTALNLPTGYTSASTYWTSTNVIPPVNGSAYPTLVIGTSMATVPGTYNITIRGISGNTSKQTVVQLTVLRQPAPTITGYSWSQTPQANISFGGTVNGSNFFSDGIRVFFCKSGTSTCYQHPGVTYNSSNRLTLNSIRLGSGSWQFYVQTAAGQSSRSSSFTVR